MSRLPQKKAAGYASVRAIAIVAILLVALFGGTFHHHSSASESTACPVCHTGLEKPATDLATVLADPWFAAVGSVAARPFRNPAPTLLVSGLAPRAPPASTLLAMFRESCAGVSVFV